MNDYTQRLVEEYEAMIDQLNAERYTHSNETLEDVIKRVSWERPESPRQQFLRRAHEAKRELVYTQDRVATVVVAHNRRLKETKPRPRPVPDEWHVIRSLRAAGLDWHQVAYELRLPYSTVRYRAGQLGLIGYHTTGINGRKTA